MNANDGLTEEVAKEWFSNHGLRPSTKRHIEALQDEIRVKIQKKCGYDYRRLEGAVSDTIARIQRALKNFNGKPRKSHLAVFKGIMRFHINKVISTHLDKEGKLGLGRRGLTLSELVQSSQSEGAATPVVVSKVKHGSVWEQSGLMQGDVIKSVNNLPVKSIRDAGRMLLKPGKHGARLVLIRGSEEVEVHVDESETAVRGMFEGLNDENFSVPDMDAATEEDFLTNRAAEFAFSSIPNDRYRAVIVLRHKHDMTYRQIWSLDKRSFKSVGNVRLIERRALKDFFLRLEQYCLAMLNTAGSSLGRDTVAIYQRILHEAQELGLQFRKY